VIAWTETEGENYSWFSAALCHELRAHFTRESTA